MVYFEAYYGQEKMHNINISIVIIPLLVDYI